MIKHLLARPWRRHFACRVETRLDPCLRTPAKRRDESRRGRLRVCATLAAAALAFAQTPVPRIAPNDLKADVSFLASDELEGRATPSKGLDIAAEFIASQFRRAGLEPAGDDGYFQTAPLPGRLKPVTARNVAGILRGLVKGRREQQRQFVGRPDQLPVERRHRAGRALGRRSAGEHGPGLRD